MAELAVEESVFEIEEELLVDVEFDEPLSVVVGLEFEAFDDDALPLDTAVELFVEVAAESPVGSVPEELTDVDEV